MHDDVYLEVYVHMIARISTRCNVCVHMMTKCASRLDVMCISRLVSSTHTVYEMMNDVSVCVSISTRSYDEISSRLMRLCEYLD